MKVEINLNKDEENERIVIYATKMTKQLEDVIRIIESTVSETKLYGKKEDEFYPIELDNIVRFYSENKQIYAEDLTTRYRIDKRLYELEKVLPQSFIRISQSEIININFIKKLKQEVNGFIKISFTNGADAYSSRRYVKVIKEALQL